MLAAIMAVLSRGAERGGFESLVVASDVRSSRQSPPWTEEGPLLRFQIGLEDPRDLITDLAAAFAAAEG
jgi:cystathionine beta-lyase